MTETNIRFGVFLAPQRSVAKFKELKKLGADFSYIDPFDVKESCDEDYMNYFGICDKVGVDGIILIHNFQNEKEENVGKNYNYVKKADFSRYKSVYGVHVWDEPIYKCLNTISEQYSWLDEKFSDKYVYANLFPEYVSVDFLGSEYEKYVCEYCEKIIKKQKSKTKLCTDIYPLLNIKGRFKLEPTYLHNLDLFAKKATEYKTDLEIMIQTTDFNEHKSPSGQDMSAQILLSFAFGAKDIVFFTYRTVENNPDSCENQSGIILPNGKRSPRYYQLKKTIKKCKKLDRIYSGYSYLGAYAVSDCGEESVLRLDKVDKLPFVKLFKADKNAVITANKKGDRIILSLINYNFESADALTFEFEFENENYECINSDGKKIKAVKNFKGVLPFGMAQYFIFQRGE